jgi:hypothetical protein
MNKKAFELTISTLVLFILGILILIALYLAVSGGFEKFKSTTDPFTDTAQASATKQGCSLACSNSDKLTFCCEEYEIDSKKVKCEDKRLEVSCPAITCEANFCGA